MSAPSVSIYNRNNSELVSVWELGTLKAQKESDVLTINIWNNKGGVTSVSDLKEACLMVLDAVGDTANDDVAKNKWVQVNVPSIDGEDLWTPIGGSVTKDLQANSGVEGNSIAGVANDGKIANSPENVCTINLKVVAPANSNPGNKYFKIRLSGSFT